MKKNGKNVGLAVKIYCLVCKCVTIVLYHLLHLSQMPFTI